MNKQIWVFGLTFLLISVLFTSLILIYDPGTNINIYSIGHIVILFVAGIGLILKKRIGWIFSHIFSIECTFLYITAIVTSKDSPYFGENSSTLAIAISASIAGLIILWSIYFLNSQRTLTLFKTNNLTRALTFAIGILFAVFNIYRV